jgi:hypothetical protein
MTAVEEFKHEAKASGREQIWSMMWSLLADDVMGCNIG